MITIRHASIDEKRKSYEWLYQSDTTPMHSGAPDYPENPVASWEEYLSNFVDFYFTEDGRKQGSLLIIENDGEEIGNICYSCFHLYPRMAELDIWLKAKEYCGHGYGSAALKELIRYLNVEFDINKFIIRPSEKNKQAIRAYEKSGFKRVEDKKAKKAAVKEYILPQYLDEYSDGDYGFDNTATLTLEL